MKKLFRTLSMKKELKDLEKMAKKGGWETTIERRPLSPEEVENTFIDYVDEYGFAREASLSEISKMRDTDKIEVRSYEG